MSTETTIIARAKLIDGKSVQLWSDGLVTFAFGFKMRGIGSAQEEWAIKADLAAGWAFMGEAGLFTAAEAPKAIRNIRKAFRDPFHGRPGFTGFESADDHRRCMRRGL